MNLKKKFWGFFCVLVCMFLVTMGGCKKSSEAEMVPVAALLQNNYDCKQFQANTSTPMDGYAADQHEYCIDYQYNGNNTLTLTHINAGFNCCPGEISADIQFNGNIVTITEREQEQGCKCLCLFDLDYEIANLAPGEYTLRIIEPYIEGNDQVLEFTLQLQSATSGSFCLPRNDYPWQ